MSIPFEADRRKARKTASILVWPETARLKVTVGTALFYLAKRTVRSTTVALRNSSATLRGSFPPPPRQPCYLSFPPTTIFLSSAAFTSSPPVSVLDVGPFILLCTHRCLTDTAIPFRSIPLFRPPFDFSTRCIHNYYQLLPSFDYCTQATTTYFHPYRSVFLWYLVN